MKGPKRTFTEARRDKFLALIAAGVSVADSCAQLGLATSTVYKKRKDDEAFASAWADADEIATQALETEARRRALEGVDEPVFHNGEVVGTKRRYSDTLLIFLLKARRPQVYRERYELSSDGSLYNGLTEALQRARQRAERED